MTGSELRQLLAADLYRYAGSCNLSGALRTWRWEPGFRISTLMRLTRFLRENSATRWGLYHLVAFFQRRIGIRYGVYLDPFTEIGGGLYLPHPCGIIVNRRVVIGRNCNLSQHVTLGVANRGERRGTPSLGDRVYLGPGAVVFGEIKIGDDVAVGANSVVTKDAPAGTVVAGAPARIISDQGSVGYVNQILPHPGEPDQPSEI